MSTKLIMSASAIVMGVMGILATFMPQEILNYFGVSASDTLSIIIQIIGALYVAFGLLNWMSKDNKIGGIYGKPLAKGNFAHFFIAGMALIKGAMSGIFSSPILLILTGVYVLFAILFILIAFTDLIKTKE